MDYQTNDYGAGNGYDPNGSYGAGNGYDPNGNYGAANGYDPNGNYGAANGYNPNGNYGTGNGYNPAGGYDQNGGYTQNAYGQNNGYNPNGGTYNWSGYGAGASQQSSAGIEAVRECGKSVSFLVGTIAYSVAFLMSFIALIQLFVKKNEVSYYFSEVAGAAYGSSIFTSIVLLILTGITLAGMWLFFASCAGSNPVPSTLGITLCRGVIITNTVFMIIGTVIAAIAMIIVIAAGGILGASGSDLMYELTGDRSSAALFGAGVAVVGVVFVIVMICLVLAIIYMFKQLATTKAIRNVLRTGVVTKQVSMYHIVFNFISVVGSVITFLSSLISGFNFVSALQTIAVIVSTICVTVSLLSLRSKFAALMTTNTYGNTIY